MRHTIVIMAAVPALALAACNGTAQNNSTAPATMMEDNAIYNVTPAMAPTPAAPTSQEYVRRAAIGDMFEIQASKLALDKSKSADIRNFAQQMIDDHTATTKRLESALNDSALGITPPTSLDADHEAKLDALRSASGQDFDRLYLDQQTAAHQDALDLHRNYAASGDNAELRSAATEIAAKVSEHLDKVKQLDSQGADGTQ